MIDKKRVIAEVEEVYRAIDARIDCAMPESICCKACGCCCDFGSYGHRLYVTTPEIIYFRHYVRQRKPMIKGVCPFRDEQKRCTVHPFRFSGCRIYLCDADKQLQSELSEFAISRFRQICEKYNLEYIYQDLTTALESNEDGEGSEAEFD